MTSLSDRYIYANYTSLIGQDVVVCRPVPIDATDCLMDVSELIKDEFTFTIANVDYDRTEDRIYISWRQGSEVQGKEDYIPLECVENTPSYRSKYSCPYCKSDMTEAYKNSQIYCNNCYRVFQCSQ